MIPSYTTLETATRALIEDRTSEAEHHRLIRTVQQGTTNERQERAVAANLFAWLRQFATRVISAEA